MSASASVSSVARQARLEEHVAMDGVLVLAALVGGLLLLDLLALRFGVDSRRSADRRPDCWW
jgi:hypothetical protein